MPARPFTCPHVDSEACLYIPAEICDAICKNPELTVRDLHALSLVSSTFHAEAQRFLYSTVEISGYAKLVAFCTTVLRQPQLIKRTRKLVLHLPFIEGKENIYPEDIMRIVNTLHLATNLKDLRVFSLTPEHVRHSRQIYMLEGHAFKLTTFVNTFFVDVDEFVRSQPTIVILGLQQLSKFGWLKCPPPGYSIQTFSDIVPNTCPYEVKNLVRLHFASLADVPENPSYNLFYKCDKLKSLKITNKHVDNKKDPNWGIYYRIMETIAWCSPDIKFFQIMDYTETVTVFSMSPFPWRYSLPQIETFILRPPTVRSVDLSMTSNLSSWRDLQTDERRISAATAFMEALPTLKRLVFGTGDLNYEYTRTTSTVSGLSAGHTG